MMVEASIVNLIELTILAVGVMIAILQLREINKTRRRELAMQFYNRATSTQFYRQWTDLLYAQDFSDHDEWLDKYGPAVNPEATTTLYSVLHVLNDAGLFLKEGHAEPDILFRYIPSTSILTAWEKIRPIIDRWRKYYDDPMLYDMIPYLVNEVKRRYPQVVISR